MAGCVYNTNREWFEFIREADIDSEINFWRVNTNNFRIIQPQEYFWLRVRTDEGKRKIMGYGIFERYEVLTINDAWKKYEEGNGATTKDKFIELMKQSSFGEGLTSQSKIGCIILNEVHCFEDGNGIDLEDAGIHFPRNVPAGIGVDDSKLKRLVCRISDNIDSPPIDTHEKDALIAYLRAVNQTYEDAPPQRKAHVSNRIERDPRIKNALKKFHDKCQICREQFFLKKDGKTRYSEVHHIKSLSEGGGLITDNCIVVCANCHRKMHYAKVSIKKERDFFKIKINDEPVKKVKINKVDLLLDNL